MEQNESIPSNLKPISAWGYIGYRLLFSIPIVGIICLIIFSLNNEKINRRNLARSYLLMILIGIIIMLLVLVIAGAMGIQFNIQELLRNNNM